MPVTQASAGAFLTTVDLEDELDGADFEAELDELLDLPDEPDESDEPDEPDEPRPPVLSCSLIASTTFPPEAASATETAAPR